MKRILILSANPNNTARLRLEKEVHDIKEGLKRSIYREQFELIYVGAVTLRDFYLHMLETKPHIVHFSGHGGGEHGLVLEDDNGKAQFLQTEQLAEMFRLFASDGLECVVLNACYSEVQAKSINQFVPYVIGMNQAIGDRAAITFGLAFYDALGAGRIVNFAFDLAKTQLIEFQENQKPVLLTNTEAIQQIEPEVYPNLEPSELVQKLLESLLPSQFESVVLKYKIPSAHLSTDKPQAYRAIEVIRYAEQMEGRSLTHLLQAIHKVAPHLEVQRG